MISEAISTYVDGVKQVFGATDLRLQGVKGNSTATVIPRSVTFLARRDHKP